MTKSIQIRDQLLALVGVAFPEIPAGRIEYFKQDDVEHFPAASVYLEPMESERAAMRGVRLRTQSLAVAIYRSGVPDVTAQFAADVLQFEALVEERRRAGEFPAAATIELQRAEVQLAPTGGKQKGSLIMTYEATYQDTLT